MRDDTSWYINAKDLTILTTEGCLSLQRSKIKFETEWGRLSQINIGLGDILLHLKHVLTHTCVYIFLSCVSSEYRVIV